MMEDTNSGKVLICLFFRWNEQLMLVRLHALLAHHLKLT
jgi:hypothetical protein